MRRREFITVFGGAVVWPMAARAQQSVTPTIGFLYSTAARAFPSDRTAAFRQGLNEAGFAEGRNVAIEFRFAENQLDRLPALATDLVRRGVSTIVTNSISLPAVMAATSTIPIVFVGGLDPVAQGFVASLNRPSGNVTGVSMNVPALNAKRLELLHELVPKSAVTAVLLDASTPTFEAQLQDMGAAAHALGRQIVIVKAAGEGGIDAAFITIAQAGTGALFVGASAFFEDQRRKLVIFAARHALPASYEGREFVEAGGLMSYGSSKTDACRRGGVYVGRVLNGAKPSELRSSCRPSTS
jgi:putative ABC transport system substrate-binding protein